MRAYSARLTWSLLGLGTTGCLVYPLLRPHTVPESAVYLAVLAVGLAMSVVGVRRARPASRRAWVAIALGLAFLWAAELVYGAYETVLHVAPYPSPADVLFLLEYPPLALGLAWLVRGRTKGRDWAAFLDAAIISVAAALVLGILVVAPVTAGSGQSLLLLALNTAYPVGDILLLAISVRLLLTPAGRSLSFWSLLGGLLLLLTADIAFLLVTAAGEPVPVWPNLAWLASALLIGFAALHPSAARLSEPAPTSYERPGLARVVALGLAIALVPVTMVALHLTGHSGLVLLAGAAGVVVAALAVARTVGLVRHMQRQAVQLAALARSDSLTGLPNRRTWDHELSRACAAARTSGEPLTVALVDLDHFKDYNDSHGHHVGDVLLREATAAWHAALDERGTLARYGGEEFGVLLPRHGSEDARRLLETVRAATPREQTCSIGAARWDGVEAPASVLVRADRALYQAKAAGRDLVVLFDDEPFLRWPAWNGPAAAHGPDGLRIVLQPIVDLHTSTVVGHEALSRFAGRTPKAAFAAAHRQGADAALEAAAIRAALPLRRDGLLLAVNISLDMLADREVQTALPGDLSGIVLEISETGATEPHAEVTGLLAELRARGATISVDDWGVGYANVERVLRLDPEIIKLDMSLVRHVDTDPRHQALVTSVVTFARQVGATVCAEGVETHGELETLTSLGVPLAQGFLLGRPEVPAQAAGGLVRFAPSG